MRIGFIQLPISKSRRSRRCSGRVGPDSRVVRLFDREGHANARPAQLAHRSSSRAAIALRPPGCGAGALGRACGTAAVAPLVVRDVSASIVTLVDPSSARTRRANMPMSATITPGMLNSASSRPSHIRVDDAAGIRSGTRSSISWRSPVKVSDRQSTERASVSKILSRGTRARADQRAEQRSRRAGDMGIRFIAPLPRDRRGPARPSPGEDRGRCVNRRQNVDLQPLPVRNGSELCHCGAKIFLLL